MEDFVHLHVHSQYSVLDGQAAVPKLVDKAIRNGMRGMALTDHGNMMGIKEFFNCVTGKRKGAKKALKSAQEKLDALNDGTFEPQEGSPDVGKTVDELRAEALREIEVQSRIANFMPIFGCEMYVARRGDKTLRDTKEDQSGWHLVVLAKNEKGYHNLVKLVSRAWVDGFYFRPRTDRADLERYHEGLIISSACLGGEVPQKIMASDMDAVDEAISWYKRVFGDDYYLELQRHEVVQPGIRANRETYEEQKIVNAHLVELAKKHGVKLICTNDCHFVDEENGEAHDRLICLATNRNLSDENRMLYTKQEWFKTREEMNAIFSDIPEALSNTCEILEKVEYYSIDHGPIMPNFDIPADFGTEEEYRQRLTEEDLYNEFTQDENGNVVLTREEGESKIQKLGGYDKLYRIKLEADYLGKLAYEGAKRRYGDPLNAETAERIKFELHIMKTMGFPGYFLIVQDYIRAAREELDVSVGPGRGSAAGSAVAYCLGITQVDPIKYDLLFERFLNPDRISLPDIDVDFDDDGRGRVLNWVTQKYHPENCAHIITYGTMATKSALKDVARVQKLPIDISNRLVKLIPDKLPEGPDGKSPKMNLPNAIACIPELREAENSPDPLLHDTIEYAKMLEGNVRNTGVHACGFIICRDEISDWVPVSTAEDKTTGEKVACTQYEGRVIEETGLIKMDFLGLKTLSIIRDALENIRESLHIDIDIDQIPIDDPATYQLYCDGRTIGTFQFESSGMQRYLIELQPSNFEDLIAMNALYRPGPMQYIPQFIKRKHGEEPITYDLECMEKYLKDTYGITVYQEQVMLLSREIADFTRGESDALRKAMGKKLIDKLNNMYPKFISGGTARGYDPKVLEKIWNDWQSFASYAFNKSHATCYSWVAYQTAYLKANYPAQYMAGVMSRNLSDIKQLAKLLEECESLHIRTLGPDLNESRGKFSVNRVGDIRFGLVAIKGVGEGAVEAIIKEREANGPFKSTFDFMERINFSACNKKCIENLIVAGAFDSLGDVTREQFLTAYNHRGNYLDELVRYGLDYQKDKANSMASLFDDICEVEISKPVPPAYTKWSNIEKLNREKDLVGLYISGHPLDEFFVVIDKLCTLRANKLDNLNEFNGQDVFLGGVFSIVREGTTSKGKPYGFVQMDDYTGSGEISLFGDDWARWRGYFSGGSYLYISAHVEALPWNPDRFEFHINKIEFLSDIKVTRLEKITITTAIDGLDESIASNFSSLMRKEKGPTQVYFRVTENNNRHSLMMKRKSSGITVTKELIDFMNNYPNVFNFTIN